MNIAIKFYSQNPNKPAGMPDEWPWLCREIGEATAYTSEEGPWTIMTIEQYNAYFEENFPKYEAYQAAQV
jgi:hypothetical protein